MDDQNDDGSLGYTVLHNSSCQHAAPTYINLMNAAILRLATHDKNMTIHTRNHPLPMTKSQHLQRHVCYSILYSLFFIFWIRNNCPLFPRKRKLGKNYLNSIFPSAKEVISIFITAFF